MMDSNEPQEQVEIRLRSVRALRLPKQLTLKTEVTGLSADMHREALVAAVCEPTDTWGITDTDWQVFEEWLAVALHRGA